MVKRAWWWWWTETTMKNNGDEHKVTTQIQQRKLLNEMCKAQKVLGQRSNLIVVLVWWTIGR